MKTLFTCILLLAAACSGCRGRHAGKPRPSDDERLPRLETVQPQSHDKDKLKVTRTYLATVEALEKVDLCAQVRGVVKTMPSIVDIGRQVTPDEVLIELFIPDVIAERENKKALLVQANNTLLQSAQAIEVAAAETTEAQKQIQRFKAEVAFRALKQKRVEELVTARTVSPQMKEEADLELKSVQAALEVARAQVITKEARHQAAFREKDVAASKVQVAKAEADRLEALVGFATLRSPFPAVITKRWVNSGDTIKDAGVPLLTVQRLDKVRVLIDVPEPDVPHIIQDGQAGAGKKGNPVKITIPALGKEPFFGTITLKAEALDPITRTMRAEIHLDNQKDAKVKDNRGRLKPNMTGSAEVALATRTGFTVPTSALERSSKDVAIRYIADPKGDPPRGLVKRMEVQLGMDDGLRVEISSDKLTGKEWVIVRGGGVIRAGDTAISVPLQKKSGESK
jgi:HlyD family secretion protein